LSAENIGVASAAISGVWGVITSVVHLPPGAIGVGVGAIGTLGTVQAIKARAQARRARRKKGQS
jgi:hypothetical protein